MELSIVGSFTSNHEITVFVGQRGRIAHISYGSTLYSFVS